MDPEKIAAPRSIETSPQMNVPSPPPNWRDEFNLPEQTPQQPKAEYPAESEPTTTSSTPQPQPGKEFASIRSKMTLSEWRASATVFDGFYRTTPKYELENASWRDVCSLICPSKPDILNDKREGRFFVPCRLRDAPLVGNTLITARMKGLPTNGKMRSASHVTDALFVVLDVDGLPEQGYLAALDDLNNDGISYIAFTTFSHGSAEKPHTRARISIAFDRPITPEEYALAWHGIDQRYFGGQLFKTDPSGARLHQQQGVWSCHPSRTKHAQFWRNDGGVASVDLLIQIGKTVRPATIINIDSDCAGDDSPKPSMPAETIFKLLKSIDPDLPEPSWFRVIGAVHKATYGSFEGLELVDGWSSGGRKYKGFRDVDNRWKYYSSNENRINIGTLIFEAKQAGADVSGILNGDAFEVIESEEDSDEGDLAATTESSPPLEPLAAMQEMFGLLSISGKLCVFKLDALRTDQDTARKLYLSSRFDGALLIERAIRAAYPEADAKALAKEFFFNPDTVCYHGIEFNPIGTSTNHLNLWEGPTIKPMAGTWFLIQEFFYDVICKGDFDCYLYLLFFIAHALQRPEEKPGVMIILIGGQGVGKGTLGRILQKIWSATYIQVNNIDAVVGTFNAILERAYIVFMDEALFAGNRRGTDELKSIVTETIIQISEKYQPSRQIRSVHRFIAATNADHFKNTERDDRRDFTLRVSEARKGDHGYWKALNEEIEYGGVEAMVHDMLTMDLTDFNVRNKPCTKELIEQKLHSLDPIQRWWHDCLYNGAVADGGKWPDFISTTDAIKGIIDVNGGRIHKKPSAIIISQALQKLCPSASHHQKQDQFSRHRGYLLPPLQQARAEFEQYLGGAVEWHDLSASEECELHGPLGGDLASRAADLY